MADKKAFILLALLVVLAGSVFRNFEKSLRTAVRASSGVEFEVPAGLETLEAFHPGARPARSEYAWWGRSPFQKEETLELTGIAWDEKNPKAIIRDRILGVGEEIQGSKVIEIRPTSVRLSNGFYEFELELPVQETGT